MLTIALAAAAALPTASECQTATADPDSALAQAWGLQGYIYGYPLVDLLKQQFNETHRTSPTQPVSAPINQIAVYPHLLTPATQGQLRAPNADTLYLNAWIDLRQGPALLEVPDMGQRYYTLALMDLYGKPHHLGTRTNGGKAAKYALIGPSGGAAAAGYQAVALPTDTIWMLGRVLVTGPEDEPAARKLAQAITLQGAPGEPVSDAAPLQPFDSLAYFALLNQALHTVPARPGETAMMAQFDRAGFGPAVRFDADKLSPAHRLGLSCALRIGPEVLKAQGFRPSQTTNGWLLSRAMDNPGDDFLLRAEAARGGYVNAREESIYPAAIMDSTGQRLDGNQRYRIRFASGQLPPVDAFWSITAYGGQGMQLSENAIHRYNIGDRTKGLKFAADGSLSLSVSNTRPREGTSNWLPVPPGPFTLVARLYLPHAEALDGRYALPPVERID
mgnify:CR=1 FL=1